MTYLITPGNNFRSALIGSISSPINWSLFLLWSIGLSLIACALTHGICPDAVGGGLPEIRTIISGTVKPVLLSGKLIITKISGLSLALLAGLSIGTEGPNVHIACALADNLMKLPFFISVRRNDAKRLELLSCACAAGISGFL